MSYDTNVFYYPQTHDLTQVAMIDFSDGSYQFDYRVVWQHKDGKLYTARDSGCSCPSPFEKYNMLEDLERANIQELIDEARIEQRADYYCGDNPADYVEELRKLL